MKIKGIRMKNFKSHKDTELSFDDGITIITGENGAGKSTILEAIHYALFKKGGKDVVMHNTDKATVELEFVEKGNQYKVTRTKDKNKSSSSIEQMSEKGEYYLLASSNKEVDNIIQAILNMDIDLFTNAIYIRQGEITDLTSKAPSERKKLITKLLKIDELEKSWEKLPQVINAYENKMSELKGVLSTREDVLDEIVEKEKELAQLKKDIKICEESQDKYEKEKSELSDAKMLLYEQKSEYALLSNDLKNERNNLGRLESDEKGLVQQYEKIIENDKEMYMLEEKIDGFNINLLNNRINGLNSEIKYLNLQNKSLKKSLNDISKVEGKCPVCQSEISEEQRLELMTQYEQQMSKNNDIISQDNEDVKSLNIQLNEAEHYQSRLMELKSSSQDREQVYNNISQKRDEIRKQKQKINDLSIELENIDYDEKEYSRLTELERKVSKSIQGNVEKTGIIKGKISKVELRLKVLEQNTQKFENIENEIHNIKDYIGFLQDCRSLYSKNGIQYDIRASVKPLIERNTKEFFEKFNFDYSDLALTDDYEVSVMGVGGETSISMMSGGEQIAVALALRLGITETIAKGNIECIILDEPTVHLDTVRINELSNLLGKLNIVPQVIIVTHEQSLENVADSLLKVEKNDGVSIAKMEI